jgi:perosamine synthetase
MINTDKIIETRKQITRYEGKQIALHEPSFSGNEWKYLKECLDTGWVSSVGKFVDKFEQDLVDYTGAQHAIVTVNGTSALHISFHLAGVLRFDEVLVPALTFVGTVNAISYCGATPHFIDCEKRYLGIDAVSLDDYLKSISSQVNGICVNRFTKRPIRCLCVMHTLGHPVDLDEIEKVCQKYHLVLIEDAAEALGSYYKGTHVGHQGLLGTLSFNGNKIITTGGGGAILTNDANIAREAKHLTTTAKLPHLWEFQHDKIAYNYRLPNINAALGCAQLEKITEFLQAKRYLMQQYTTAFSSIEGIKIME